MHPLRKRRLLITAGLLGLLSVVIALVMYAMRQNISLFYTPTQVFSGEAPRAARIRVGGMVVKGSIHRLNQGRDVVFKVTDFKHELLIRYTGILPDLFREGQGVVVKGRWLGNQTVLAEEVLAKHDARYMPPELKGMKA